MKYYPKKKYGEYTVAYCPFCNRIATQKNKQGLEVCYLHGKEALPEIQCSCGSWLEQRSGKFGPYFNCIRCGNINLRKGLENQEITPKITNSNKTTTSKINNSKQISCNEPKKERRETTITSNDYQYFS